MIEAGALMLAAGGVTLGAALGAFGFELMIRATALMIAAAAGAQMLRHASAALRHLVWSFSTIGLLLLPFLHPILPAWTIEVSLPFNWNGAAAPVSGGAVPEIGDFREDPALPLEEPHRDTGIALGERSGISPSAGLSDRRDSPASDPLDLQRPVILQESPVPNAHSAPGGRAGSAQGTLPPKPSRRFGLASIAGVIWLAGTLLLFVRVCAAGFGIWKLSRSAAAGVPARTGEVATKVARELGINQKVNILLGGEETPPMTWGIMRPTVLLPRGHEGWSRDRLERVLIHEFSHVRRRDYSIQLLSELTIALYWMNPLVWFTGWRLRVEREVACDDAVLRSGALPSAYADDLLEIVRSVRNSKPVLAGIGMAHPSELHGRLASLLSENRSRAGVRTWGGLSVLLAGGAGIVVVSLAQPTRAIAGEGEWDREPIRPIVASPWAPEEVNDRSNPLHPGVVPPEIILGGQVPPEVDASPPAEELAIASSELPNFIRLGLDRIAVSGYLPIQPTTRVVPLTGLGSGTGRSVAPSPEEHPIGRTVDAWGGASAQDIREAIPESRPCWTRVEGTVQTHETVSPSLIHIGREQEFNSLLVFRRIRCTVELRLEGQAEFTLDFRGVERLERGASLIIHERDGDMNWSVRIVPDADGTPIVDWTVNGEQRAFDGEGEVWLASHLAALFRLTGLRGEERAEWLLREWGEQAMLTEIFQFLVVDGEGVLGRAALPLRVAGYINGPESPPQIYVAYFPRPGGAGTPLLEVLGRHLAERVEREELTGSELIDRLWSYPSLPLARAVASRYPLDGEVGDALFRSVGGLATAGNDVTGFLIDLAESRPLTGEFGERFFNVLAHLQTGSGGVGTIPVPVVVFSSIVRQEGLEAEEVQGVLTGLQALLSSKRVPGTSVVVGPDQAVGVATSRVSELSPHVGSILVELADRHGHHLTGSLASEYGQAAELLYPLAESNRVLRSMDRGSSAPAAP